MYLIDTNILSAASPAVKVPFKHLVDWLDEASDHLFLSVVTTAEILSGIAQMQRQGSTRRAAMLREWWATVEHLYASRILPFDRAAANRAGALMDRARGGSFDPGFADIAIAATAGVHGLTVLTRNVNDFLPLDVTFTNPYEALPPLPGPGRRP